LTRFNETDGVTAQGALITQARDEIVAARG
jgi:hypothetical protein